MVAFTCAVVSNESDMVALVNEAAMVAFRCAVVLK